MGCRLGAGPVGIYRLKFSMNYVIVECVFYITAAVGNMKEALKIGFVLGEKQFRIAVTVQQPLPQLIVEGAQRCRCDF